MKHRSIALSVCVTLLGWSPISQAQIIYGSTNLDIDPDSGTVTATCETDVDNLTAEYYKVVVGCVVKNSDNKVVASGDRSDDAAQGYVQVVLTFTGVPGETYTATSAHSLDEIYTVECNEEPALLHVPFYDDVYDFGSYAEKTYYNAFELASPHLADGGTISNPYGEHYCRTDHLKKPEP